MDLLKAILHLHYFFMRKSQHYLNGTWHQYKPLTIKQRIYFPIAYTKFMYWSIKDVIENKKFRNRMKRSLYR